MFFFDKACIVQIKSCHTLSLCNMREFECLLNTNLFCVQIKTSYCILLTFTHFGVRNVVYPFLLCFLFHRMLCYFRFSSTYSPCICLPFFVLRFLSCTFLSLFLSFLFTFFLSFFMFLVFFHYFFSVRLMFLAFFLSPFFLNSYLFFLFYSLSFQFISLFCFFFVACFVLSILVYFFLFPLPTFCLTFFHSFPFFIILLTFFPTVS